MSKYISLAERFWPKVDKSGPTPMHRPELGACWLWTGTCIKSGYGRIRNQFGLVPHNMVAAHRVAWEFANGPIPDGFQVLHRCDNPPCVNPAHLFTGTVSDNMQDAAVKGRRRFNPPRNEKAYNCKLPKDAVSEIRAARINGVSIKSLSETFRVSRSLVSLIGNGKRRKHI